MTKIIKEIYIIWLREMIRYWRVKARLISSLAMPLLWLVFFGAGMKSTLSLGGASCDFDFLQFLFPGVLVCQFYLPQFFLFYPLLLTDNLVF